MARGLIVLIIVMLAVAGYLIVTQYQNTYKLLPRVEQQVEVAPFSLWRPYTSDGGDFSVEFPTLPQRATDTIKDPANGEVRKYDMHVSEKNNGSIFMISLITYTGKEKLDNRTVLQSVKDEMVASNPNNKLLSSEEGLFQTYPAISFSIENKEAHIDGKAFFVDNTLYLLSYIAKKEHYDSEEYNHFIGSFKLLKGSQQAAPASTKQTSNRQ